MRVALDTNILVYAEGVNGASMKAAALELLGKLPIDSAFVPVQVLTELFNLFVRKAGRSAASARKTVLFWRDQFLVIDNSIEVTVSAIDLASEHQLSIWDSIVLSSAAEAGCNFLLSEDMQDGYSWRGVTVANPFVTRKNPLLAAFLDVS